MGELLVSLSPVSFPGGAVLIQSHVILPLRIGVFVQRRGVGVVPVLFKLLAENALSGELLLCEGGGGRETGQVKLPRLPTNSLLRLDPTMTKLKQTAAQGSLSVLALVPPFTKNDSLLRWVSTGAGSRGGGAQCGHSGRAPHPPYGAPTQSMCGVAGGTWR